MLDPVPFPDQPRASHRIAGIRDLVLADPDTAEGLTRAVTMIPASGEFAYARILFC
ncbi:hypothetical protein AB9K34_19050 [Sedimentitalea sp. XS_ASV28]|uniref:hypothetical protein n=1 Tax=Sedimentitalea sp. XS_ASV28 TaxID=3241296 RepID=UPI0035128923